MIQIAIMGLGTVGSGVARVISENSAQIERKLGETLQVKAILVRHFKEGPDRHLMTDDFTTIEQDPEIRVVVETIGGTGAAYEYTRRALLSGKHVVTANKQLVAERGCELLALAREQGVNYLFEASVGGGIPVLHPLTECLGANRIDEVCGILNGTTNYILTRMVKAGISFQEALEEAQEKGYAEADPTADVDGIDAGRKICILADLAFGHQVNPDTVPMEGISGVSLTDVALAGQAGYKIKLLGRALRLSEDGRTAYVAPHLIPAEHPLANVQDVFNAILVRGNAAGDVMFYGRGAGALPTASACVSDVLEALQQSPDRGELPWSAAEEGFSDPLEVQTRWYFRISGSLNEAASAFGEVEVLSENEETAFLTEAISGLEVQHRAQALQVLAKFRVLGESQ